MILMIARALELIRFAVQQKSLFQIKRDRANAEPGLRLVHEFVLRLHGSNQGVESWTFRRPEDRRVQRYRLDQLLFGQTFQVSFLVGYSCNF